MIEGKIMVSGCKGIILVGGFGMWFYLIIMGVLKQFLLIYDKLMIYYLILVLMLVGICEIVIIIMFEDQEQFCCLLDDGSQWGLCFEYIVQLLFDGLVQVYILVEEFLVGVFLVMVLGDNIFFGYGLFLLFGVVDVKV